MRLRWFPVVMVAMMLVGCQGGGSAPPASAYKEVWIGDIGYYGESYELVRDLTINGQLVKKGTLLRGQLEKGTKFAQGKWLIPPEYEMLVGREGLIYGRRVGDKTFVHIDISTGRMKAEPTAFTSVHLLQFTPEMGYSQWDRWVGMTEGSQNVTLLDNSTGRPVTVFKDVAKVRPQIAIELLRAEGSLLVHHASFDRLYAADGTPISPVLFPPLWIGHTLKLSPRMAPEVKYRIFAFAIDGKKKRYWPLQANGRVFPRPDDLLGLEPLYEQDPADKSFKKWSGWLVWWKMPEGERCAHIPQEAPLTSYQAIMASRAEAKWVEYLTTYDSSRALFTDIRKAGGSSVYEVNREYPLTDRTFATVDDAKAFIRSALAEEKKQQDIASARAQAAWEAEKLRVQRLAAERRAAALAAERQAAETAFDAAMSRFDQPTARSNLLKLDYDPQRWTAYVKTFGLDPSDQNGSNSVGYARATQGGTDPEVLKNAVKAAKRPQEAPSDEKKIPLPQSDWDYFWNGPRDGSYAGPVSNFQSDPNLTIGGVRESQHQLDRRNMDAWMRGAQSWGGPR